MTGIPTSPTATVQDVEHARRPRRRARAAFTLLEVAIAIAVLTIALVGITGSIVTSDRLQRVNRESALAEEAVRSALEALHGADFPTVFAQYNGTNADDPGGVASPGAGFAVAGLTAPADDADGLPGAIEFPVEAGTPGALSEDVDDAALGMPSDLNGDGVVDAANHAADYRVLPVRVRVRWTGANGVREVTVETVLCAR